MLTLLSDDSRVPNTNRHVCCPVPGCSYSEGQAMALECVNFVTLVNHMFESHARDQITSSGELPSTLLWAAKDGHEAVVRLLLDRGAVIESRDTSYGQSPLSWAAEKGHEAVVRLLLDRGADTESRSKTGKTPLQYAEMFGGKKTAELLQNRSS